jgi:myo-inositol 2-dehydrogenase/D-chiro-inositol 1-dehydrogenase
VPLFVEKPLALDVETARAVAAQVVEREVWSPPWATTGGLEVVQGAVALLHEVPPQLVTGYGLDTTPSVPWRVQRADSAGRLSSRERTSSTWPGCWPGR